MAIGKLFSGLRCWSTSHRQNDAELRLAAHHARVSLGRFFERICFNHGTHAGQFGEVQCTLLSMYTLAPSFFASAAFSEPRPTAATL